MLKTIGIIIVILTIPKLLLMLEHKVIFGTWTWKGKWWGEK